MEKNELDKELTPKSHNNINGLNTKEFSTFKNNIRKDVKGNVISKRNSPIKKTKHHAYLIDNVVPGKDIANIIEIESFKKYNVNEEEEEIEDNNEDQKADTFGDNNVVISHGCCFIF